MNVLILDDEPDIRFLTALALTRYGGMSAREAASAEEAIVLAHETTPDVILLDVFMPREDGPTVLARLRDDTATAACAIIFMTANPTASDIARLIGLGALAVLEKPFDPITLGDRIREVFKA